MCELSSPFLHWAKATRKPVAFLLFAIMFTLCRIVWVPVGIMQPMLHQGIPWTDLRFLAVVGFYALNCLWYYKILRILLDGVKSKEELAEEKKADKENKGD